MDLLELIKYFELIAFIVGVFYFKKFSDSYLKYFLFLLGAVVIVEFSIWILQSYAAILPAYNYFIYNVVTSIQYIYYFSLYYKIMTDAAYKKLIKWFMILFLVSLVINFVFLQKLSVDGVFHSYTFSLGAILLIASIGLFFAETLKTDRVLYFKRYLMFWISIGLFTFYTSIVPLILIINFLPKEVPPDIIVAIMFILNLMMYSCFTLGFILGKKYTED